MWTGFPFFNAFAGILLAFLVSDGSSGFENQRRGVILESASVITHPTRAARRVGTMVMPFDTRPACTIGDPISAFVAGICATISSSAP
jgi:hypothetical protein